MKAHYDFSKGEKGKFYFPEEEIDIPIYLNDSNKKYFVDLARNKNITLSNLINKILSKDKDIVDMLLID